MTLNEYQKEVLETQKAILQELKIMNANWAEKEAKLMRGGRQAFNSQQMNPGANPAPKNEPNIPTPETMELKAHMGVDEKL